MNNLIALFLPLICVPCRPVIINNPLSRHSLIHFSFPGVWRLGKSPPSDWVGLLESSGKKIPGYSLDGSTNNDPPCCGIKQVHL